MGKGHKVAAHWAGPGNPAGVPVWGPGWALALDGQPTTWRALEDLAETYEPLAYRLTDRRPG